MNKKYILLIILIMCFYSLVGCKQSICFNNNHTIIEATCTEASYCRVCKKIFSDPLGHNWIEENINAPKQCKTCDNVDFSKYDNYNLIPYDNNIAITIREMEHRYSKYATGDNNNLGQHEKSIYDLQITLTKLQTKTIIHNINIYVVSKNKDNSYSYNESINTSKSMGEYSYTLATDFNSFSSKEYKNILFENEPIEFYIKVTYKIDTSEEENILTYRTSVVENVMSDINSASYRNIIDEKAVNNSSYINPINDPIRIKLTKNKTQEESSIGKIKEDTLRVQLNIFKEKLNSYKYDDNYLKTNKLTGIEMSKTDEYNVYPEINNLKLEIYVKIKSTDKNFSEYVKIYSIYGFMSKYRDLSIAFSKFDESFKVEDIYIIIKGNLHNAKQTNFNTNYFCKYSELYNM